MTLFLTIVLFILCIVLGIWFYFLHKRLEDLSTKNDANTRQLIQWMETLRDNQSVLESDLKKVYNEFQSYQNDRR